MKVKEKIYERRGRPRKYTMGEVRYRVLWAPENLLLELRIAARVRGVSMNDEVVGRLIQSLDFTPKKPIIKTEEGERLLALARLFDEFIQSHLDMLREKYAQEATVGDDKRPFVAGKMRRFSSSFPVNLKKDMEISARFNQRSMNQEIVQRLLGSLNYFTEQQLPENEEIKRLRSLAVLFDEFIVSKVAEAENPLTNKENKKLGSYLSR
ncbi:Arc family DNA-binding protein [Rahnella sp. WP5]|uniref:Arc family DNA-binding protein n=1 Tax=Rahnella sp. WP5 TaxID=1500266 RepID=UPI000561622A|nr:Arc family DNA-binding protein [Rahnella sp. WP5]